MRPTKPGLYFYRYKSLNPNYIVVRRVVSIKIIGKDGDEQDVLVFTHCDEQVPVCLTSPNDWFYPDQDSGDWIDGTNIEIGDYVAGYGKISSFLEVIIFKKIGSRIKHNR